LALNQDPSFSGDGQSGISRADLSQNAGSGGRIPVDTDLESVIVSSFDALQKDIHSLDHEEVASQRDSALLSAIQGLSTALDRWTTLVGSGGGGSGGSGGGSGGGFNSGGGSSGGGSGGGGSGGGPAGPTYAQPQPSSPPSSSGSYSGGDSGISVNFEIPAINQRTYYVQRSGQNYGPYTYASMGTLLKNHQVNGSDRVWRDGLSDFQSIKDIPEFASALRMYSPSFLDRVSNAGLNPLRWAAAAIGSGAQALANMSGSLGEGAMASGAAANASAQGLAAMHAQSVAAMNPGGSGGGGGGSGGAAVVAAVDAVRVSMDTHYSSVKGVLTDGFAMVDAHFETLGARLEALGAGLGGAPTALSDGSGVDFDTYVQSLLRRADAEPLYDVKPSRSTAPGATSVPDGNESSEPGDNRVGEGQRVNDGGQSASAASMESERIKRNRQSAGAAPTDERSDTEPSDNRVGEGVRTVDVSRATDEGQERQTMASPEAGSYNKILNSLAKLGTGPRKEGGGVSLPQVHVGSQVSSFLLLAGIGAVGHIWDWISGGGLDGLKGLGALGEKLKGGIKVVIDNVGELIEGISNLINGKPREAPTTVAGPIFNQGLDTFGVTNRGYILDENDPRNFNNPITKAKILENPMTFATPAQGASTVSEEAKVTSALTSAALIGGGGLSVLTGSPLQKITGGASMLLGGASLGKDWALNNSAKVGYLIHNFGLLGFTQAALDPETGEAFSSEIDRATGAEPGTTRLAAEQASKGITNTIPSSLGHVSRLSRFAKHSGYEVTMPWGAELNALYRGIIKDPSIMDAMVRADPGARSALKDLFDSTGFETWAGMYLFKELKGKEAADARKKFQADVLNYIDNIDVPLEVYAADEDGNVADISPFLRNLPAIGEALSKITADGFLGFFGEKSWDESGEFGKFPEKPADSLSEKEQMQIYNKIWKEYSKFSKEAPEKWFWSDQNPIMKNSWPLEMYRKGKRPDVSSLDTIPTLSSDTELVMDPTMGGFYIPSSNMDRIVSGSEFRGAQAGGNFATVNWNPANKDQLGRFTPNPGSAFEKSRYAKLSSAQGKRISSLIDEISRTTGIAPEYLYTLLDNENSNWQVGGLNKNRDGSTDYGLFQVNSNYLLDAYRGARKRWDLTKFEEQFPISLSDESVNLATSQKLKDFFSNPDTRNSAEAYLLNGLMGANTFLEKREHTRRNNPNLNSDSNDFIRDVFQRYNGGRWLTNGVNDMADGKIDWTTNPKYGENSISGFNQWKAFLGRSPGAAPEKPATPAPASPASMPREPVVEPTPKPSPSLPKSSEYVDGVMEEFLHKLGKASEDDVKKLQSPTPILPGSSGSPGKVDAPVEAPSVPVLTRSMGGGGGGVDEVTAAVGESAEDSQAKILIAMAKLFKIPGWDQIGPGMSLEDIDSTMKDAGKTNHSSRTSVGFLDPVTGKIKGSGRGLLDADYFSSPPTPVNNVQQIFHTTPQAPTTLQSGLPMA
jgi:hypothetical protein